MNRTQLLFNWCANDVFSNSELFIETNRLKWYHSYIIYTNEPLQFGILHKKLGFYLNREQISVRENRYE